MADVTIIRIKLVLYVIQVFREETGHHLSLIQMNGTSPFERGKGQFRLFFFSLLIFQVLSFFESTSTNKRKKKHHLFNCEETKKKRAHTQKAVIVDLMLAHERAQTKATIYVDTAQLHNSITRAI